MRLFEKIKRRGISLARFNAFLMIVTIVISVILFVDMQVTSSVWSKTHKTTQDIMVLSKKAMEMNEASDYLTEQIRSFAITGEKQYLDDYFTEAEVTRRRESALESIREYGDEEAYNELKLSLDDSIKLMDTEYYAARLTIEAYGYDVKDYPEKIQNVELTEEDKKLSPEEQNERSTELLFSKEYSKQKDSIATNMQDCLDILSGNLDEDQEDAAQSLRKQVFHEHVITMILIILVFAIVFWTYFLVIRPLKLYIKYIRNEDSLPVEGAYEVRFLAKTYNLMYNTHLASKEQLNYQANHDKLTGVYNRRGYEFLIDNVDIETTALLVFDLDNFKEINDNYGHGAGDKVLARVTSELQHSFRSEDFICRMGGDEFVVIMVHTDVNLTELIRKKIAAINEKLNSVDEKGVPAVTVSVGVAFGDEDTEPKALIKKADKALYEAKENGKHDVCFS